jgi:hypothetical protein
MRGLLRAKDGNVNILSRSDAVLQDAVICSNPNGIVI